MDPGQFLSSLPAQLLVGLSRAMILFIVSAGLSFVLGVLRVPNVAHGSLYMLGAFAAYGLFHLFGSTPAAFWAALLLAPLIVAGVSLLAERGLFQHLYKREHLTLLLFTFSLMLILNDLVKMVWGAEFRSVVAPPYLNGSLSILGSPVPRYNLFLLLIGPLVAVGMWLFVTRTRLGKIARAAAVDIEMVGALGINVSWIFAAAFVIGCTLAGLGGALIAPTVSISLGMSHDIIMEAFLIVIIGGLGNIWGALLGALIFGLTQSLTLALSSIEQLAFLSQFTIVIPYLAVVVVLLLRPRGLLKSVW